MAGAMADLHEALRTDKERGLFARGGPWEARLCELAEGERRGRDEARRRPLLRGGRCHEWSCAGRCLGACSWQEGVGGGASAVLVGWSVGGEVCEAAEGQQPALALVLTHRLLSLKSFALQSLT